MGRPFLAMKIRSSSPQEWFGRPLREVSDHDMARWYAIQRAAEKG